MRILVTSTTSVRSRRSTTACTDPCSGPDTWRCTTRTSSSCRRRSTAGWSCCRFWRNDTALTAASASRTTGSPPEFTLPPPPPSVLPACGRWRNVSGVNVLTHLYSEPAKPKPAFNNYKIISDPRSVFVVTVHGVLRSQKSCAWMDRTIARMYHTKTRGQTGLKAQQLIYDGRLLSYSGRLTPAVNAVLQETQLLPE